MQTSAVHYETHLGAVYSWMLGDIEAAFARSAAEIDGLPLSGMNRGIAVDLGAGIGLHTLPLAQRGFDVTAIDSCQVLLEQLRARCAGLTVTALNADLLDFRAFLKAPPNLILCMGDTLTHVPTLAALEALLGSVAAALPRGGVFATTFRDYATRTLQGDARFILVRADARRILTCFLEYTDQSVIVHDVLTELREDHWRQTVSSYPKLKVAPEWLAARLAELGFEVSRGAASNGMVRIVAVKS
jgi:2-polyprenyl-3-methyl-5-hydroxy-6-metoxy-1,4-benzoquinol methylase